MTTATPSRFEPFRRRVQEILFCPLARARAAPPMERGADRGVPGADGCIVLPEGIGFLHPADPTCKTRSTLLIGRRQAIDERGRFGDTGS
jgi:hypothetical protein